jgi:hypothetical protein
MLHYAWKRAARVVIPSLREPHPESTRSPSALLRACPERSRGNPVPSKVEGTGSVEVDLESTTRYVYFQSGEAEGDGEG